MFTNVAVLAMVSLSVVGAPPTDPRPVTLVRPALESGAPVQNSHSRSSRIVYRDRCGWQGSGRVAYVQNSTRNRSVVVTVRESYSSGRDRWSRTQSYSLEPGAEQWVGCTRGDTAVEWKSYSIVGERSR
jgi:hypothetical protein